MKKTNKRTQLFNGSTGLNNNIPPSMFPKREDGLVPFSSCLNVYVDDSGRVNSCLNNTTINSFTSCSSMYSTSNYSVFIADGYLQTIDTDNVIVKLVSLNSNKLSYSLVNTGLHEHLYYVGDFNIGIIRDGKTHLNWTLGSYNGPTTSRVFSSPINGHLITIWNGRMLIANNNHIFCSEPYNYNLFDYDSGRLTFESRITMMCSINNDLWVSDSNSIYFISGVLGSGEPVRRIKKCSYASYEGVPVLVNLSEFPLEGITGGIGYLTVSSHGIVLLAGDGLFRNLTEKTIVLKDSNNKYLPLKRYSAVTLDNKTYFWIEGDVMATVVTDDVIEYSNQSSIQLTSTALDKTILINSTNPCTVYLPSLTGLAENRDIEIIKMNTGTVTVSIYLGDSGDTISTEYGSNSSISELTTNLYSSMIIKKISDSTWFSKLRGTWSL